MEYFLGMTHDSLHREGSFNDHTLVPGSLLAQLEISRYAIFTVKVQIHQRNHTPSKHSIASMNSWSCTFMGNHFQPTTCPKSLCMTTSTSTIG